MERCCGYVFYSVLFAEFLKSVSRKLRSVIADHGFRLLMYAGYVQLCLPYEDSFLQVQLTIRFEKCSNMVLLQFTGFK